MWCMMVTCVGGVDDEVGWGMCGACVCSMGELREG